MGDIVEIQESADRIFIKENKDGSIICVHDIFGIEFNSGNSFLTTRWEKHEWRRKQETKYIPFTFEDRELLKGAWVVVGPRICQIIGITPEGVDTSVGWVSYDQLFSDCLFDGGAKCGKIKNA